VATAVYTGLDGSVTTVPALDVAAEAVPFITGTYTLSYNFQYTAIAAGSYVKHEY
jgi:hypothetical protein